MDKETEGKSIRAIKDSASNVEVPISDNYAYVRNDDTFIVDSSEFEMIQQFLSFTRERKRGVFTAEIITHMKRRIVNLSFTDKKQFPLTYIPEDKE